MADEPVAFKIRERSGGPFLLLEQRDLALLAEYMEPGDRFTIERVRMTRAEIDNLPDFDGF